MIDLTQRAEYLAWANARLGQAFTPNQAVTLTRLDAAGSILGVVVFSRFTLGNCEVSVVGESRRWLNKELVIRSLLYVFHQLNCRRCTAFISVDNKASLSLAQQLGFRIEGTVEKWFPTGDAYILGLLPENCKILRTIHGQPFSAASS